jgi:hypothetical protein
MPDLDVTILPGGAGSQGQDANAPAAPRTDVNVDFLEAMAAGLKRVHEDEAFRKEVARRLS